MESTNGSFSVLIFYINFETTGNLILKVSQSR